MKIHIDIFFILFGRYLTGAHHHLQCFFSDKSKQSEYILKYVLLTLILLSFGILEQLYLIRIEILLKDTVMESYQIT